MTRLLTGQPTDLRYQAATNGFSLVKILQIGTEVHKIFFSTDPSDKAARTCNYPPLSMCTKTKDKRAVTDFTVLIAPIVNDSCVFTFCWYTRCQIQQYIKIVAFFVCHFWPSNNISLWSVTVLTQNCANYGNDRQHWAEIGSLEWHVLFLNTDYSRVICCLYKTKIKCSCCVVMRINLSCTDLLQN